MVPFIPASKLSALVMFDLPERSSSNGSSTNSSLAVTLVGSETTTEGSFELGKEDLRIDGTVIGEVRTEGRVYVGPSGTVRGTVRAASIQVAGTAEGVLLSQQSLVTLSSAVVRGILCAGTLTIEEGTNFEGGVCHDEDRLPALVEALSAADEYPLSDLLRSTGEWESSSPDRFSKAAPKPATVAVSQPSSPTEDELRPSPQGGDSIPAVRSDESRSDESRSEEATSEEADFEDGGTEEDETSSLASGLEW